MTPVALNTLECIQTAVDRVGSGLPLLFSLVLVAFLILGGAGKVP